MILKVLIIINVRINLDILNQKNKLIDLESELLSNFFSQMTHSLEVADRNFGQSPVIGVHIAVTVDLERFDIRQSSH